MSDYGIALLLDRKEQNRKLLLLLSIVINLGLLFTFKYFDFFISSFYAHVLNQTDTSLYPLLHIVLPAGISFYTFQTMSYTIDVYKREIKACKSFIDFFLFVSFFPQLVAGPIEKAGNLLPQLRRLSHFRFAQFRSGTELILYGLVKKVLIADQIGVLVDECFLETSNGLGNYHLLGALLFSIQIYCDFSGYSDIAIGTGRLLGIRLLKNFDFPYFTTNPRDFWKHWHISLYNWLRDYLFIPLGGSRVSQVRLLINILIVFALSGLWHGANWTFILWGLYNGLLIVLATFIWRKQILSFWLRLPSIFINYGLILFGWILFRADSVSAFIHYVAKILTNRWSSSVWKEHAWALYLVGAFILFEYALANQKRLMIRLRNIGLLHYSFKAAMLVLIYLFASQGSPFIYFQF